MDSLSRANIPQYGVIAARALNRGADLEDMYGMQPGARYEYYLIVHPPADSVSLPTWQLEQLEIVGNQRNILSVNSGILRPCYHRFVRGARADFKTCAEAMARPASFGNLLQGADGGPLWISCSYGCCTSEAAGGL